MRMNIFFVIILCFCILCQGEGVLCVCMSGVSESIGKCYNTYVYVCIRVKNNIAFVVVVAIIDLCKLALCVTVCDSNFK